MWKKSIAIVLFASMIVGGSVLNGCVSQQQQQGNQGQPIGSGVLRLLITDKPGDYTILHANVTISQVQVHLAGISNLTANTSNGGAFNVTADGPYQASIGGDIQFLGNASGGKEPYNWSWEFGDGNSSFLQNPFHNFSVKGIYPVNLTVRDDNNSTAWDQTYASIGQDEDNSESGWLTVVNESQTFDLVALRNVSELLGEKNLTAGTYTQIRLTVESAEITINTSEGVIENHTLQVPSEKIKLIHPFMVTENTTTVLTLDFDVNQSVHETGNGKFMLKPTIKIVQE